MSKESQEEPKLIIDEDWKTQVEREKEELKRKAEAEAAGETEPVGKPESGMDAKGESEQEVPPPPPATFSFLLTSLATQAMVALGQFPAEDGKPLPVNLEFARHFIDLMGVLEDKTIGNLDDQEKQLLKETLHQMRMMFVAVSKQQAASLEKTGG